MFKIGVLGHFSFKKDFFDGQTVKTKMLAMVLEKELGQKSVIKIDTHGGLISLPKIIFNLIKAFIKCDAVIMLPAQNGIKIFAPLFVFFYKLLKKKILYVVIGGWLPEKTKQRKWLSFFLKKFDAIYVETNSMKFALEKQGFNNIFVMPNFKNLQILQEKDLVYKTKSPFNFCMFSRVMKEKGIEEAIDAITELNKKAGYTIATLDIYGKIDDKYKTRFEQMQESFPAFIQYKGVSSPTKSVNILKNYFALLFPTYYAGEGFAGTLLDAMSAGIPVIASDWKYNKEIVIEGKNGVIISKESSLLNEIEKAIEKPEKFNLMKSLCLKEVQKYNSKNAINILLECLK